MGFSTMGIGKEYNFYNINCSSSSFAKSSQNQFIFVFQRDDFRILKKYTTEL